MPVLVRIAFLVVESPCFIIKNHTDRFVYRLCVIGICDKVQWVDVLAVWFGQNTIFYGVYPVGFRVRPIARLANAGTAALEVAWRMLVGDCRVHDMDVVDA